MKKAIIGGAVLASAAALVLAKRIYDYLCDVPELGKHDIGFHDEDGIQEIEIEDPGMEDFYIHVYRGAAD